VGFSTYNFGALARYKIPALPFYAMSLFVLNYYADYYRALRKKGKASRNFGEAIQKGRLMKV
jgi:Fic family protein